MPRRPREDSLDRQEAMTLAAWLYYERDLDQAEVARRMELSRSQISRLLTAARDAGVVEVRVHGPLPATWRLGQEVADALGIETVQVGLADAGEDPRLVAARAAARLIDEAVRHPLVLGLGWGRTLGLIGRFARQQVTIGVEVYDIVGRPIWPINEPPFEVSSVLARAYGAPVSHVPAPAIVESAVVAKALMRDSLVSAVLGSAAQADLTVVAIGHVNPDASSLVLSGAVPADTIVELRAAGAVAEIIGHFFDSDGNAVAGDLDERIVGLSLAALKASKQVVAVAAGADKVTPIRAAARGALLKGLVTNVETARLLLEAPPGT